MDAQFDADAELYDELHFDAHEWDADEYERDHAIGEVEDALPGLGADKVAAVVDEMFEGGLTGKWTTTETAPPATSSST